MELLSGTAAWLKQTVTIYPYSSESSYGDINFGSGVSVACRIEASNEQRFDERGRVTVAKAKITVDGSASVTRRDKVKLPGNETLPIIGLDDVPGPDGNSYLKVIYV